MRIIETSAKNGSNIKAAFEQLVTLVHEKSIREESAKNKGKGGKKEGKKEEQTIQLDDRLEGGNQQKGGEEASGGCC